MSDTPTAPESPKARRAKHARRRRWTYRPSLYVVRSRTEAPSGKVYEYAYLRYEVWDGKKGRLQPVPLASLGRTDALDPEKTDSLIAFIRQWIRKDCSLSFEALKERFSAAEPTIRILCSRSFGLRALVEQAWTEIGYRDTVREIVGGGARARQMEIAIFAMVLVQIIAPRSKRGAVRCAGTEVFFPEGAALELKDLYRAMDVLGPAQAVIEQRLAERLRALGVEPTTFVEDTTTVVCRIRYDDRERAAIEAERQASGQAVRAAVVNVPPLRLRGESKEKRRDLPQVDVEAILGDDAIVVHHATHPGNASDKTMVGPSVAALQALGYKHVLWASDSGFNSAENRDELRAANFEFVSSEGVARTKVVKRVLATAGRYSPHPDKPELSFKCVRAEATEERRTCDDGSVIPGPMRLYVVRRNLKEEAFQLHTIARHVAAVEAALAAGGEKAEALLKDKTYRRYVRRDRRLKDEEGKPIGPPILNRKAVEHLQAIAGKSVIASDCLNAPPLFLDDLYRRTADLERLFRDLKSSIEVGPIRHRRADRICAHVMLAIMAKNVAAWLARKSGLTLDVLRDLFANCRVQKMEVGGATFWQRTEMEKEQRDAIMRMGYTLPPLRFMTSLADNDPSNTVVGASDTS
jgi:DDE family transposase